jgi:hypothetical protein
MKKWCAVNLMFSFWKNARKFSITFYSLLGELYRLRKEYPKPLEPDLINVSVGKQPVWPASSVKNCLEAKSWRRKKYEKFI